jgi:hypothetical protein
MLPFFTIRKAPMVREHKPLEARKLFSQEMSVSSILDIHAKFLKATSLAGKMMID